MQGAAQAILGTLLEPFAQARRTFGTVQDSENYLHAVMTSAGATGAVKFLRREVLTTLRRPPFAAQNMVSESGERDCALNYPEAVHILPPLSKRIYKSSGNSESHSDGTIRPLAFDPSFGLKSLYFGLYAPDEFRSALGMNRVHFALPIQFMVIHFCHVW